MCDSYYCLITGNYMYVFGGYEEIIERFGQDVYRLDLTSYTWKLLVSLTSPQPSQLLRPLAVLHWRATRTQGLSYGHGYRQPDGHIWW